ncbi:MAG: hypothetical protein A3E29_02375 [Candidatus Doudnabacteria bacterium RIFCSPHIGHO2_12_FULL_48_16]|uniref:RiboL-PSP-HEPN domain-containing protein n=1 Tax=Candidatus Doudnabacteria bacterium RIFCSPHIGHO2_12_FULL_48_16 TaxID=1817838 RepID=A0A1F5PL80_9BACT|nr:MAG: hypothetical protein A3E29_02375 [Candidatus Doudnabacteria bacterium RIFCSPHIGHO2_12_FULL_48_16]
MLPESKDESFNSEYNIFLKTVESVNNLSLLYETTRAGEKGPASHSQQDLYRAMLIFACAGLDVFFKKLIQTKLSKLINHSDTASQEVFKNWIANRLKKPEELLNTVALALTDINPRETFIKQYIENMTGNSLQSYQQLYIVCNASGLQTKKILKEKALDEAFSVRNKIIHEMDINSSENPSKTKGYRTRNTRTRHDMEKHTRVILDLIQDSFSAYKTKFKELNIETKKEKIEKART